VLSIAAVQLLSQLMDGADFSWVRNSSLLVSLAVFAVALRSPDVDARLKPVWTFGVAVAAFGVISALAWLLRPDGLGTAEGAVSSLIALAWTGFATAYVVKGSSDGRPLLAWYGLTMFGLALAELMRMLLPSSSDDLVLGAAIVRFVALLYAVVGVTRELQTLFATQSSRLLQTTVDTLSTSASLRAAQQRQEELAHEARNALTAIEGATQTLERFRTDLDEDTRRKLALAVSDEIGRLQRLVSTSSRTNHPVSFRLSDIIGPQIDLARAQGAQISAQVPTDLAAYGRPADFAEVLQNLLVNARVHGRNPIVVRVTGNGQHILVRVEDHGPGVPPELRQAIFERGLRASDAPGSGLGLYVSRQLLKELDGNLWVEDADSGGASFVVAIPAGPVAMTSSFTDSGRLTVLERGGNGGKPANGHLPASHGGAEHADVRARARRGKHQKPID
jgi:signal transduction histidine kinase